MKFLREAGIFGVALIIGGYIWGHRSTLTFTSSTEYLGILGVTVGILTFLLAFLAIVFTYLLYRQSSENKKSFDQATEQFFEREGKAMRELIDDAIAENSQKLESASEEEKVKIRAVLKDLEAQKALYKLSVPAPTLGGIFSKSIYEPLTITRAQDLFPPFGISTPSAGMSQIVYATPQPQIMVNTDTLVPQKPAEIPNISTGTEENPKQKKG